MTRSRAKVNEQVTELRQMLNLTLVEALTFLILTNSIGPVRKLNEMSAKSSGRFAVYISSLALEGVGGVWLFPTLVISRYCSRTDLP